MQWNWLTIVKAKETEAIEQAPTLTPPAAAWATCGKPMEASDTQSQMSPEYCATIGKICPTEYPIPIKEDWSDDSEDKKESQEQNKRQKWLFWYWRLGQWFRRMKAERIKKSMTIKHPNQTLNPCLHLKLSPFSPPSALLISLETKLVYHQYQRKDRKKKSLKIL